MNDPSPPIEPLVLGYIRVSTDRQDLSLDAQTETVRRFAEAYRMPAVQFFAEPNTSGKSRFVERPVAGKMLVRIKAAIAARQPVTVIVSKVDRLGRDTIDVSQTVNLLQSLAVKIVFLDLGCDSTTPMGRAFVQIAAVLAELELARIHERIEEAFEQKRSRGELCGTVPYGWDAVETGELTGKGVKVRKLEDNPAEQRWILRMVELREAGWGYHSIANELNRNNVPTKRGCGEIIKYKGEPQFTSGKWQSGLVSKILNSTTVQAWLALRKLKAAA